MGTKYNAKHAREILEPCGVLGEYLLIDDRGVWPEIKYKWDSPLLLEHNVLRWQPADELQNLPNAPEASETPMLPMPFTARQLAAFMLAGAGALVADFYGDWGDGPDPQSLNHIDPKSNARRAVVEAFTAYRLAHEKLGELDLNAQTRRDAANQTWLTAMVQCLLEVAQVVAKPATPYHLLATPAELIDAFGMFTGMNKSWFTNAKDTPRLLAARHTAGQGGKNYREPLYWVFDVMTWLTEPQRKGSKVKQIQTDTAWRILKNKFPKVYEEYQDQEPTSD